MNLLKPQTYKQRMNIVAEDVKFKSSFGRLFMLPSCPIPWFFLDTYTILMFSIAGVWLTEVFVKIKSPYMFNFTFLAF